MAHRKEMGKQETHYHRRTEQDLVNLIVGQAPDPPVKRPTDMGPLEKISATAALKRYLSYNPDQLRTIIKRLVVLAMNGDIKAIDMIFDRLDGLPSQSLQVTGELPVRLMFVPHESMNPRGQIDAPQVTTLLETPAEPLVAQPLVAQYTVMENSDETESRLQQQETQPTGN